MLKIFLTFTILIVNISFAGIRTLCSEDNRDLSSDHRIGRIMREGGKSGCSATLIGNKCAITAGHCGKHTDYMEFDVPASSSDGVLKSSSAENIYKITKIIDYEILGKGDDWMVFTLGKNLVSGEYPGNSRGHYDIKKSMPKDGDFISVTGYGKDSEKDKNFCQQASYGNLIKIEKNTTIYHNADTTSGNSGSSIVDYRTGQIIGIHTDGGCNYSGNKGTYIMGVKRLRAAIEECLNLP